MSKRQNNWLKQSSDEGDFFTKTPFMGIKALVMPFWVVGYIKNRRRIETLCQSEESSLGEYLTLKAKYKSAFIYKVSPPTSGTYGGIDRSKSFSKY